MNSTKKTFLNNFFYYLFGILYNFFKNTVKTSGNYYISASFIISLIFTSILILILDIFLITLKGVILNYLISFMAIGITTLLTTALITGWRNRYKKILISFEEIRTNDTGFYRLLFVFLIAISIGSYFLLLLYLNQGYSLEYSLFIKY
jgi:hypothetical protein